MKKDKARIKKERVRKYISAVAIIAITTMLCVVIFVGCRTVSIDDSSSSAINTEMEDSDDMTTVISASPQMITEGSDMQESQLPQDDESTVAEAIISASAILRPATGSNSTMGQIIPCLKYQNRIYYWRGLSLREDQRTIADLREGNGIMTILPDNFELIGDLKEIGVQDPSSDLEIAADFPVSGTLYASSTYPEAVYARVTTENIPNLYVRLTTDLLGNRDRCFYAGSLYDLSTGEYLLTIPEEFSCVGLTESVDCDALPSKDFEVNCIFSGLEVYTSDQDSSVLFIRNLRTNVSTADPIYFKCPQLNGENDSA